MAENQCSNCPQYKSGKCDGCPHQENGGCPNCPFSKFMNDGDSHSLEELLQFREKIQNKLAIIDEEIEKVKENQ